MAFSALAHESALEDRMGLLDGKVVVVTGASKGIGAGLAVGVARHGARVAINYKSDADGAAETVRRITAGGGRAIALQADVGKPGEARQLIAAAVEQLGAVNVLVNNAGRTRFGPASGVSLDDWDDVVDTNLKGTFFTTVAAVERMPEDGGSVINISSCAATLMVQDHSIYTMSKTGIEGLSRQLALEYAPRKVRVNVIAPAATSGERNLEYDPDYDRKWASVTPMGRVGSPGDYVGPAVFLASDMSSFLTGQTLNVDGGWSLKGHTPDMSDYDYSADRKRG
jgi:NAD(P)-dependent dehydrogenase (short-subunit alcohol dehydrogenase family)